MDCAPPVAVPLPQPSARGGIAISYSVLRICDHNGCVRYEVVPTTFVRQYEKQIQDAYLRAAREWKPGQNPDAPQQQPNKPEVRVWRVVMGGPDARERAMAVAEDCRRKELKTSSDPKSAAESGEGPSKLSNEPIRPADKIPGPLVK